ncbi:MAG: glycosyltransferase [candidate division Zixibacteria bacterium]
MENNGNRQNDALVCYAEDWGRLPSSTQHLMRKLSSNHTILWVDSLGLRVPSVSKGDVGRIFSKIGKFFAGVKEVEPNIFVLSPLVIPLFKYSLIRWINRQILKFNIQRYLRKNNIASIIQWSSCPTAAIMLDALGEKANVYYIGDEFSEFTQFDKDLVASLERLLLIQSDLLLVVSDRLVETKSKYNPSIYKLPHGCDYEHFAQTERLTESDIPGDLRTIKKSVIGYYGLIRDWFDFEMLKDIFSRHPEWSLVLIGPCDTDTSLIDNLPNVHLLGPKPYEELPNYLKGFDVCIIPYRISEITINANPLKLLEYMASGKPVITTDLPSVHSYSEGLTIAKSAGDMESGIENLLSGQTDEIKSKQVKIARENSWTNRAEKIESLLEEKVHPIYRKPNRPVIMHVIAAMEIAGAEKVLLNLIDRKDNCPYEMRVTSFVRGSDGTGTKFLKSVFATDTTVDRIPMCRRWDLRDVKALMRIIKRQKVSLLHTHGYKSDIVGVLASKLTGVPIVATSHGFTSADEKLKRNEKIDRFILRFAHKIICVSKGVYDSLVFSGIDKDKLILIPNAIDFEYFSKPPDKNFRESWGVASDEIIIGTAGRLSLEKAHTDLVKGLAIIPEDMRNRCRLVIAGDGPEKEKILEAAKENGVADKLIMAGYVNDMRSFFNSIDVFCLSSLAEGTPLTALEAAASGLPLVMTSVGGSTALINDGVDGFLIEPSAPNQLADALSKLIDDEKLRNQFAREGRDKLKSEYDIVNWSEKFFDIYRGILR